MESVKKVSLPTKEHSSIILGIDPGSRITGYGLIKKQGNQLTHIDCGLIQTKTQAPFSERLYHIFLEVQNIINLYQPDQASIEDIFTSKNAASAFKLGHARGAAITAIASLGLSISEYSAKTVKKSVTGYGNAEKQQIQQMISSLLKLPEAPYPDAADALAVAICHAHHHSEGGFNLKLTAENIGRTQRARIRR